VAGPATITTVKLADGSTGTVLDMPGTPGWSLMPPVNVLPGAISGWHIMQFTYLAGGNRSVFAISNFAVDPRFIV
jgi:hypothetical protein